MLIGLLITERQSHGGLSYLRETPLSALARFQADLYKKSTDDALFTQNKYDRFIEKAKLTSHVIAICMQKRP